jgi:hypothetical protein
VDRHRLFRHVNHAAAALADLLQQFVTPDVIAAPFARWFQLASAVL